MNKNQKEKSTITKTIVKSTYGLTDKDLENIECQIISHPVYKSDIYLYEIADVEAFAINKYGSIELMHEHLGKKQARKADLQKNKQNIEQQRIEELQKALQERKLEYRDDSEIMQKYITKGEKAITLQNVLEITSEIQFFRSKTKYSSILKQLRNAEFDGMDKRERFIAMRQWTEDEEECLRKKAKKHALKLFVKAHLKDFKKAMLDVPQSLQQSVDKIYNCV